MFKKLNSLRGQIASLGLAIAFVADNRMTVIVTPVVKEELNKEMACLATPFTLTGTPEELDAEFAGQFDGFATVITTLADQTAKQIAEIQAKAKATADAAAAKKAKTLPNGKGKATPSSDALAAALTGGEPEDDDEDDSDNPATTASAPAVPATAAQPVDLTADSLF